MTDISDRRPVAVIGATGHQGGAVVEALEGADVPVRALVRDAASPTAQDLAAQGVDVVEADQEDVAALTRALDEVSGLFFHTTYAGADGSAGEVRRGLHVVEAAAAAGVPRVVYSSVGGAERGTGVSFFDSKKDVEQHVVDRLAATVIRPVFFMENLLPQLVAQPHGEVVLRYPMAGDVPVQMIAVRDIGRAAAHLLRHPDDVSGTAFEIAGDEVTLAAAAALLGEVLHRPARYEQLPPEVLGDDDDVRAMFEWFSTAHAYQADFAATRALVPDALDLRRWIELQVQDGP